MEISESLCNPKMCNYECQEACTTIHGEDSPLRFGKESLVPIIDEDTCTECLACIRACPLNAISIDGVKDTLPAPTPPPPEIEKISECPYEVSDQLSRMSEADTIFARVQFDPEYEFYQKIEFAGAEHMISKNKAQ